LAVYTCFDMVHDCAAGAPAGWRHFVKTFLPALRDMARHYGAGDGALDRAVESLRAPGSPLWNADSLIGERDFLARLRPLVAGEHEPGAGSLDLETVAAAFEPLTLVERQVVWLEIMRYDADGAAVLMRISPESSRKIRERAGELLRSKVDAWSEDLLTREGAALQAEAAANVPEHPVGVRDFLDIIDGRATWSFRRDVERKLEASWYEIDHFCRLREADQLLRAAKPLDGADAATWLAKFGVTAERQSKWRRLFG
jgi:hypothetical protein